MAESRSPVIWSPEATDDIDKLWDYYVDVAGRTAADKVLREVARTVATIDDFPLTGRSRDEIREGLRSLSAGSQIVLYRLKDRPEIVRVLDGRRDIDEIFSEGEAG
jgi:toxin ParE1/3/4